METDRLIFTATPLLGSYVIDAEKINDHRGYFARAWCERQGRRSLAVVGASNQRTRINNGNGKLMKETERV
jgi:dTDP-4-dehydrorhamnose 3,5-epimerase-like enzyme